MSFESNKNKLKLAKKQSRFANNGFARFELQS